MSLTKDYCTLPHGQIHFRMMGSPDRRPLALLHQTPSSSTMYNGLMAELATDYWCLAPDTPGFGQSDPLTMAGSDLMSDYAAAIHSCLIAQGIERCYLFGHHTGAAIAAQITYDYPAFVIKLALSGPPLLTQEQIDYLKTTLPTNMFDEDGRFLTDLWLRLRKKAPQTSLALILRETISALQSRDIYHQAYHAVFNQDFSQQLQSISCPILLMAGQQDSLIASLKPAAKLVKNGRYYTIPNAGTYICDTQPKIVAKLLSEFFS